MKKTMIFLLLAVCVLALPACEYGADIAVGSGTSPIWDNGTRSGETTASVDTADDGLNCIGPPLETNTMIDTICPPPDPIPDYTKPFPPTLPAKMDLEFWITDDVSGMDFSDHAEVDGWFGAREFYGLPYAPTVNGDGDQSDPEYYVKYLITAFPDYADGGQYVTRIEITDPAVEVYGLTVDSSLWEFDQVMTELGFKQLESNIPDTYEFGHDFTRLGVHFDFTRFPGEEHGKLIIWAEVTNREGISF